MIDFVDTGTVIKTYMEENDITIEDLANASDVSIKTIYRILNNQSKLNYKVASGINKLIPEITEDFLMSYDAKYQVQIKKKEDKFGIDNLREFIDGLQLRKLYPDIANDENALIEKGMRIVNSDCNVFGNVFNFDVAKNAKKDERDIWIKATYEDYLDNCGNNLLDFDENKFNLVFSEVLKYCGTTNEDMTIFNMQALSKKCGINFFYRASIPNSRIKGVVFKNNGRIFIFISDLFKCIERLWISYVHEFIHIKNKDYDNSVFVIDEIKSVNEERIKDETVNYFIRDGYDDINVCDLLTVYRIAEQNSIPKGIAAYLVRNKTSIFNNADVNNLIHYY